MDCYVVSATKFDDLRKKYDDGSWERSKFTEAHILFMERNAGYDYMKTIFANRLTKACT